MGATRRTLAGEDRLDRYRKVREALAALEKAAQSQEWQYVEGFVTSGGCNVLREHCWLEKGGEIHDPTVYSAWRHFGGPAKPGDEASNELYSVFALAEFERLPLCGADNPEYSQAKKDAVNYIREKLPKED